MKTLESISIKKVACLADLFGVFDRVSKGESMALCGEEESVRLASEDLTRIPNSEGGSLGVFSSGSTGEPKLVWKAWPELLRETAVSTRRDPRHWASPFKPWTYAGVQVALQAWLNREKIVSLGNDWGVNWSTILEAGANAVSCTPTFLDLLLQNQPEEGASWQPGQITLGGEVLRPGLGRRLESRFSGTRFTVIYAAAEFGILMKTHRLDGWYEIDSLARSFPQWRVNEGELQVQMGGEWKGTGDLVEVKENRMRVLGRGDDVANVAGTKVNLHQVAEMAEEVPGVRRAVAVAEPSAITGQIVCLKYARELDAEEPEVKRRLQETLHRQLPKAAWPRRWEEDELLPERNSKRRLT